jgi:LmbE family N-acetylglucosaminyl deacetylase
VLTLLLLVKKMPSSSWERVLVLAVHPDDESLSAGGLIQQALARGADVRVVFVTDGDNNPWPQRFVERRWQIDASARFRWGKRRETEAVAALARLGVPREGVSFWHYPDQGITRLLLAGGGKLIDKLSHEINQWRPNLVVAPSLHDLHADHSALAVLLHFALARDGLDRMRPFDLVEYLVHSRGGELHGERFEISLSPEQVALKRRAILSHDTQMALSRRRFLKFAQPTEVFMVFTAATERGDSPGEASADFQGDFLCLKLARVVSSGTILIAMETAAGSIRLSVALSSDATPVVREANSGEFEAYARLVRGRDADRLYLPAALFADAENFFVKIVSGRGFFDRAGWCLVPLQASPPLAAVTGESKTHAEPRVCAVIPCYNLAEICGPIIRAAAGFADYVIAVNDGSEDETESVLRDVAAECANVQVLNLPQNCGKGIALMKAFHLATSTMPFDILITLDGDGQHRPEDIPRLASAMVEGNHALVIGERLAREKMPLRSRLGNTITAGVMKLVHPAAPTDTQSGYRAFHRNFVREIVEKINGGRYETELEILLLALRQKKNIGSVTIPTVYLEGNRLSHFRPIIDSWRIYRTLFRWQL